MCICFLVIGGTVGLVVSVVSGMMRDIQPVETSASGGKLRADAAESLAPITKPEKKEKIKRITAAMEAALEAPEPTLGDVGLPRAELAKAAKLVHSGLEKGEVVRAFQDVQAAQAFSQTAETAEANGVLLSDEDIEELSGSAPGVRSGEMHMAPEGQQGAEELQGRRLWVAAGRPWSNGSVNYCFPPDLPERTQEFFKLAAKAWELAVPCLKFFDVGFQEGDQKKGGKCKKAPAIFVGDDGSGCNSFVGMTGSHQKLNLHKNGCVWLGTILHEIGHALGMAHEQSRPDRDGYIAVKWQNIEKDWQTQFAKGDRNYDDGPYDYLSIMHYGPHSRDKPWFTKSDGSYPKGVGQRTAVSKLDIDQVFDMYEGETPHCQVNGKTKSNYVKGCVNTPGATCREADLKDFCVNAVQKVKQECCACGGGLLVKCYDTSVCPNVTRSFEDNLKLLQKQLPGGKNMAAAAAGLAVVALFMVLAICLCICLCPGLGLAGVIGST